MAGHKYQDRRARLPQALLDQVNARDDDAASGAPTSRRRTADRRSARRSKREEAKNRKAQFFSRQREEGREKVKKRPAVGKVEDRPAKRPKLKDETPSSSASSKPPPSTLPSEPSSSNRPSSNSSRSASPKPAMPAQPKAPKPKSKPTPLERLTLPKSKKEKDVEDDEIAWLEAKLGIRKKKKKQKYGGAFGDDGLDDILLDLDRLEEEIDILSDEEGGSDKSEAGEEESEGAEEDEENSENDEPGSDQESSEGTNGEEDTVGEDNEVSLLKQPDPDFRALGIQEKPTSAYVPPHLRQKSVPEETGTVGQSPEQTKLARHLKGLLNRLGEQNIEGIVTEVEGLYRVNPRNDVTQTLTNIVLDSISSSANLLDTFVILHAAFIAAIHKIIGIEFAAYFVEQAVYSYETHWKSLRARVPKSAETLEAGDDSAPTGTKESSNLLVLLSELYNFQVISCVLVYDLIRALLNSEFLEYDVELLLKVVKNSGHQMRQDDPLALKDIIQLVQDKMRGKNSNVLSSRFRFLVETLVNLKNNKLKDAKRAGGTGQNVASAAIERMKKYLGGISKKRHVMSHEPLRVTLEDLHSSDKRGKWWLVGAAWAGNPLVENQGAKPQTKARDMGASKAIVVDQLADLARQHGMNTEVRRNIFVVLVSSDDYVDACERLTQLELQETQQREIVRVVLHCCGNERAYNPFYTLVAQHLCQKSHSHRITLQYCLWDFLRSLGESQVGGAAISRDFDTNGDNVSDSTISNYARAYAWWLARGSVALSIFKPVEFLVLQPQSKRFLKLLFLQMIISSQSNSPLIDIRSAESSIPKVRNRAAVEEITSKALRIPTMCKGIVYFIQTLLAEDDLGARTKLAHELLVWGLGVAKESLQGNALSDDEM
ncbi:eukaryotic translation initiation factor 4G [Ceratobasidium sp. AG-Ba]|nr:eukaryotic translation initiation factor 4G [Ceratobasidium sp. AG-Ba]QRW02779.1 eukaryotic translation initiation factor 4G [Ceratobasidium sp. AG-Ba]